MRLSVLNELLDSAKTIRKRSPNTETNGTFREGIAEMSSEELRELREAIDSLSRGISAVQLSYYRGDK